MLRDAFHRKEKVLMETLFVWPTPPYFAFAPGSEKTGPEACLIYLLNGKKLLGNMIRFSPDESSIVFQPGRREINDTIGAEFSDPYFFSGMARIIHCRLSFLTVLAPRLPEWNADVEA